jgi:alpha-mannosidase
MKQAEDGSKDIIVRLTEIYGSRGTASVTPGFGFCKAYLCNMLEEQRRSFGGQQRVVMLPYQTHEIVTVRFVR